MGHLNVTNTTHELKKRTGAFFTTSLPHLLILQYPDIRPPKPAERYVARIYGYRIHKPKK